MTRRALYIRASAETERRLDAWGLAMGLATVAFFCAIGVIAATNPEARDETRAERLSHAFSGQGAP